MDSMLLYAEMNRKRTFFFLKIRKINSKVYDIYFKEQ